MPLLLQAASTRASDLPGGYGVALLQTLLALAAVCVLAWVVLRWSARGGLGMGQGQRIRVVERVALDARRTAFLVEVGGKYYFLAAGDGGSPSLIATLDVSDVPEPDRKRTFLEVLRGGAAATTAPAAPGGVSDRTVPGRDNGGAQSGDDLPVDGGRLAGAADAVEEEDEGAA